MKTLSSLLLLFFFIPFNYIIANILWFKYVNNKLYHEADALLPLTSFLPPYIHNVPVDYYFPGWNEAAVTQIGYIFIGGIIISSFILTALFQKPFSKFISGLEKDFHKKY